MRYENLEYLKDLQVTIENLNQLVDDEDFFDSDLKGYLSEFGELIKKVEGLLDEILEDDPQFPLSYDPFLKEGIVIQRGENLTYKKVQRFGVDMLVPFLDEVNELLIDDEEKPDRNLFDQLTIPIMSLVNHQAHPTRPGYLVYHFKDNEHASYFEELLNERELFYERFDETRGVEHVYWFGVREQDHDAVEIINYTVKGKFRKPLIRDNGARYFVIGFGVLVILLAIVGAIMSNS